MNRTKPRSSSLSYRTQGNDRPWIVSPQPLDASLIWRPVLGYEGRYEVSDAGHVRNARTGWVLKPAFGKSDYYTVGLYRDKWNAKTTPVHRIVCEAFHGARPPGHQAAHLDGNKHNNTAGNMVWATPAENAGHMIAHGTMPRGVDHAKAKLTPETVREIWLSPLGIHRMAKLLGVASATIHAVRRSKTWVHLTAALPEPPDRRGARKVRIIPPPDALAMIASGATLQQVAGRFGVGATTVFRWSKL